jgi:hypothetical protein
MTDVSAAVSGGRFEIRSPPLRRGRTIGSMSGHASWEADRVTTSDGLVIPVRATSRRPAWDDLPADVRAYVEEQLADRVVSAQSAGTGFTPGFASRLDLASGGSVFVKAASSVDDLTHGWGLSSAYREEVRKLAALPADVGAPRLLWSSDTEIGRDQWLVAAYENVDGRPPRRPWRRDELDRVLAKLVEVAPRLRPPPAELDLETIQVALVDDAQARLEAIRDDVPDRDRLDTISRLCESAGDHLAGDTLVHMDLRDDNVLLDGAGGVWFVDWNFPAVGAPWVDLLCILLSTRGDGIDVEEILRTNPLTRDVDPGAIDTLLGVLWPFWADEVSRPVPASSPHLRAHQRWYLDVTAGWLIERLETRT